MRRNPDLYDNDGNPLTREDVIRFISGELDEESELYKRIQHDFIERSNGFVRRTIERISAEALKQADSAMDAMWNNSMGAATEEGEEDKLDDEL
jgi:hypothetical protein